MSNLMTRLEVSIFEPIGTCLVPGLGAAVWRFEGGSAEAPPWVLIPHDIALQAYLESIGATFADWNDSIIYELGYANYDAANSALYSGLITEEAVSEAWATLNP